MRQHPVPHDYETTLKTLLPGFVVGVMFLLAAAVAASDSDTRGLLFELARNTGTGSGTLSAEWAVLRPHRPSDGVVFDASPVEHADKVISDAIRLLAKEESLCDVERMTIHVPLFATGPQDSADRLHQATIELLSRQMNSLPMKIIVRVAPENLPRAIRLLEDILAAGVESADIVAVSVDDQMPSDQLTLLVNRSKILRVPQEFSR